MKKTPTLLLVHGSWHGPWCWEKLTPGLARLGVPSRAIALPSSGSDPAKLGTVADDAATLQAAVAAIDGDVIVVAHSYGGVVATEAKLGERVRHIVYLGAFMPNIGQGLADLLPPGPLPPFVMARADGATEINMPLAIDTFYADCDSAIADWAVSKLRLHNGVCNVTPVTHASWHDKPTTYIVLTQDHASPPFMQRELAKHAGRIREMATSHSPFLSRPEELAAMLAEIAA